MAHTRVYRDGKLEKQNFPPDQVSDYLQDEHCVVWLDLSQPDQDDFGLIQRELGLHALAVEDAVDAGQRTKVDRYDTHLFLTMYTGRLGDEGELVCSEVAVFVTERALVTVRRDNALDMRDVVARWDESAELAGHGVAFMLYGLLDVLVDQQMAVVQRLDDEIETIEGQLFDDTAHPPKATQKRLLRLRRSLLELRRTVLPMREVVNALMRPNTQLINADMMPYYQDVYDHTLRATEWTESLRDLVSTVMDTSLMVQGNRMNNIMKKVTSWAAIIAVPTAVTGFYGQNVPYPGSGQPWGFVTSSVITASLAVGLYITFRRNDWL